jgi:hypothetical protein
VLVEGSNGLRAVLVGGQGRRGGGRSSSWRIAMADEQVQDEWARRSSLERSCAALLGSAAEVAASADAAMGEAAELVSRVDATLHRVQRFLADTGSGTGTGTTS